MGKCKTKTIETDLGTFRHNQAYPGIIQVYSKPCITWHIQRHGVFRTLTHSKSETYSEPWYIQPGPQYIQNSGIFKIQRLFRHLLYQTSMMKHFVKIVNGKYFRSTSFPCPLLHEINIIRWLLQR